MEVLYMIGIISGIIIILPIVIFALLMMIELLFYIVAGSFQLYKDFGEIIVNIIRGFKK